MTFLYFHKWESLETMSSNYLFDNHLMKACLAALFAIGLTACSSSDSGTASMPEPTAQEACTDAGGRWNADETCTSAEDLAEEARTLAENRESQMTALMTASGELASALTALAGEATRANLDAAKSAKTALDEAITGGMDLSDAEKAPYVLQAANAAGPLGAAETAVAKAEADAVAEEANKARLASNAESMLVAEAIVGTSTRSGHDASADLDESDDPALKLPAKVSSLKTEVKEGATVPTIEVRRDTGVKLTAMNAMSPGDGWTAKRFALSDKSRGVVATNLGPDKVKVTEYGYGTFFGTGGKGADDGTLTTATGVLELAITALKSEYFDFPGFVSTPAKGEETSKEFPATFRANGSYRGVPGTFTCTSCELTRAVSADGSTDTVTSTAAMTFTPTRSPTTQPLDDLIVEYTDRTADTDYLRFGYWMTTTETGGKTRHMIETFVDATGYGNLAGDVATLRGKATYSGAAAGIYVHKSGVDDSLVIGDGEFVAAANLTAQFGVEDGSVAAANQWAVTGTVSGFESTTGDHDLSGWTLMLRGADLGDRDDTTGAVPITGADAVANADFVGFSGTTSGGPGTDPGAWSGSFFGGAPATGGTVTTDDYPMAAIGEFNGHFANGHVAGAFGAEKDD